MRAAKTTRKRKSFSVLHILFAFGFVTAASGCASVTVKDTQAFSLPGMHSRPLTIPNASGMIVPTDPPKLSVSMAHTMNAALTRPQPTVLPRPQGWPVELDAPSVMSPFGPRGRRGEMHRGADIKGPQGVPVHATASGVVTLSGVQSGYGNIVVVEHADGFSTAYAHLSSRSVATGKRVGKGETLGRLGATGRASTPHVHYEVRLNGRAVDPAPYLQ